jgi:hypothetical protein
LLGVFMVCSAMVLIFNLVTDLVYRLVDPRIEFASSSRRPARPMYLQQHRPSPLRPFDSLAPRPFDCGQISEALSRQRAA